MKICVSVPVLISLLYLSLRFRVCMCTFSPFIFYIAWIEAIQEAGKEDFAATSSDPVRANLPTYLKTLNLSLDVEPTETSVNKAYKRLSLTHHPDKGGDAKKVRE